MKTRPKTGEPRKTRQPLKIDRLPAAMHEAILRARAGGASWKDIEEQSLKWSQWEAVPVDVLELFPDLRLPHSNLQRWYDLRVEQARKEVLAETEAARAFAEVFKEREFQELDQAVLNAIRDQVFSLVRSTGDQKKFTESLLEFGHLVAKFKRIELAKEKVEAEGRKIALLEEEAERKRKLFDRQTNEAARKLGKGEGLTIQDINRIRERVFGLPPAQR